MNHHHRLYDQLEVNFAVLSSVSFKRRTGGFASEEEDQARHPMSTLIKLLSPRHACSPVQERQRTRSPKKSPKQMAFSVVNLLNLGSTGSTTDAPSKSEGNCCNDSVNVDSDIELFSTMNDGGREGLSPRRTLLLRVGKEFSRKKRASRTLNCFGSGSLPSDSKSRGRSSKRSSVRGSSRRQRSSSLGTDERSFIFSMNSDSRSSISFDENRKKTSKIFARNESIDSGTLSASASFHSKDTYSKETYTDNYDSSESESKSTLSSKQDSTSRVNSISTFLFFNKGSFTDHSDSSDSLSDSKVSYVNSKVSYTDNDGTSSEGSESSYSSGTETYTDDYDSSSLLESGSETMYSVDKPKEVAVALNSSRYPIETKATQSSGVSEARSSLNSFTAIIKTDDGAAHDDELELDSLLSAASYGNNASEAQGSLRVATLIQTKIAINADFVVPSLADDSTEILASTRTDLDSVESNILESVRTDELYEFSPGRGCSDRDKNYFTRSSKEYINKGNLDSRHEHDSHADDSMNRVTVAPDEVNLDSEDIVTAQLSALHRRKEQEAAVGVQKIAFDSPPPPPYDAAFFDMRKQLNKKTVQFGNIRTDMNSSHLPSTFTPSDANQDYLEERFAHLTKTIRYGGSLTEEESFATAQMGPLRTLDSDNYSSFITAASCEAGMEGRPRKDLVINCNAPNKEICLPNSPYGEGSSSSTITRDDHTDDGFRRAVVNRSADETSELQNANTQVENDRYIDQLSSQDLSLFDNENSYSPVSLAAAGRGLRDNLNGSSLSSFNEIPVFDFKNGLSPRNDFDMESVAAIEQVEQMLQPYRGLNLSDEPAGEQIDLPMESAESDLHLTANKRTDTNEVAPAFSTVSRPLDEHVRPVDANAPSDSAISNAFIDAPASPSKQSRHLERRRRVARLVLRTDFNEPAIDSSNNVSKASQEKLTNAKDVPAVRETQLYKYNEVSASYSSNVPNQRGEGSSRRSTGKEKANACALTNESRLEERDERESRNGDKIPRVENKSLSIAHENQTGDALMDGPVSSPSKRTRRFEKAIKMRDMRKNKIETKNTCKDVVPSKKKLLNDVASTNSGLLLSSGKGCASQSSVLETGDVFSSNRNYDDEVVLATSGSSLSSRKEIKSRPLIIDTNVHECAFDESVSTAKHSNVAYGRDSNAFVSPPRANSLVSPRSLPKLKSQTADVLQDVGVVEEAKVSGAEEIFSHNHDFQRPSAIQSKFSDAREGAAALADRLSNMEDLFPSMSPKKMQSPTDDAFRESSAVGDEPVTSGKETPADPRSVLASPKMECPLPLMSAKSLRKLKSPKMENLFPSMSHEKMRSPPDDALREPNAVGDELVVTRGKETSADPHSYSSSPKMECPLPLMSPKSLRKLKSPSASRDRMKTARKLWHRNSPPSTILE